MSSSPRPPIYDAHAHLVADDQTKYPRNYQKRAPNAPPRLPGVIGTPGGHHGPEPINEVPDVSRMLQWMKEEGVDGAVAVQKRMVYKYDNSYILDSSDAHPDTFAAVVILDATDPTTPELIRTQIRDNGLSGLRLFGGRDADGGMPWLNSPQALKCWEVLQEHGLVMNIEVLSVGGGGPSAPALIELSKRYPDVRIVLDHLLEPECEHGAADFGLDHHFESLVPVKNISFKWTSINLDICRESGVDDKQMLRRAVDMYGADRIMWGSDIGTSSGTYKDMVQRALDSAELLTDAEKKALFHDTGRRVFVKGGTRKKA
ncbi:MAG: amidohydrolase [Burkholderiales bacterium]|jgi:predicted TIM-barrel fold metal-dependent hydrolase|nr:amidohydrolase [Burkholderiales bacterium]